MTTEEQQKPDEKRKKPNGVARILTAILIFQVGIGAMLVLGDVQLGRLSLPGQGPDTPRLTEPVRPGDQRRTSACVNEASSKLQAKTPSHCKP